MPSLQLIEELEQMVSNGLGGWLGKRLVDEGPFLTKIQELRASLSSPEAIQLTYQLDGLASFGGATWIGKCLIDESEFAIKIQLLRSTLSLR
jgi:hypothetical protein